VLRRIGSDLDGPGAQFGPDPVEAGSIRRWLELVELDCGLHSDPGVARAHGYPDVIAPCTSAWCYVLPPVWQPGDPPAFPAPEPNAQPARSTLTWETIPDAPHTTHTFGTGNDYEFLRPLVVGERVGVTGRRLVACTPKQTRVGRGAFVTVERQVVTQDLEPVCRVEFQQFFYNPFDDGGPAVPAPAGGASSGGEPGPAARDRKGLPTLTYALPLYRLVLAAAATRDFAPIHHNDDFARASGAPGAYASALFLLGMWERMVRDLIGPGGRILSIRDFRMRRFNTVGSLLRVEGDIVAASERDGRMLMDISLRTMIGDEVTVGPGTATVVIPAER
jgi:acyl dehydratase